MVLLAILSDYKLFHPILFLAILSKINIWLLVILLLGLLEVINGYWYIVYWKLLMVILLMVIGSNFINGH
jgi:hypothetical protein